jgi:hypothetical protein
MKPGIQRVKRQLIGSPNQSDEWSVFDGHSEADILFLKIFQYFLKSPLLDTIVDQLN